MSGTLSSDTDAEIVEARSRPDENGEADPTPGEPARKNPLVERPKAARPETSPRSLALNISDD